MNLHTIANGRLVEDPRFFETKKGERMMSVRLADNFMGKRDEKYKTIFVEVTIPAGLTTVFEGKGLAKGDTMYVVGELELREYETKKGSGYSHEIRFPKQLLLLNVAADQGPADEEDPPEVAAKDEAPAKTSKRKSSFD